MPFPALLLAVLLAAQAAAQPAFEKADALLRAGRAAEAAPLFEQVVAANPKAADAWFGLGVCHAQTGDAARAVTALRSYLRLEPGSAAGRAVLGLVLLGQGQLAEAKAELSRAVAADPAQTEARKGLARIHNLEGRPAQAIPLLRPLAAAKPPDPDAQALLARALLKNGDPKAAAALLQPLLAAQPQSPEELYLLGIAALRDTGQVQAALELGERAIAAHPYSERIEAMYIELPRQALADRTATRVEALEKNPNQPRELIAVGRVMTAADRERGAGVIEGAEQLLARAVRLDPAGAEGWYHYGRNLRFQNKLEPAVDALGKALELVREDRLKVLILARLAGAQARLERAQAAEANFRAAVELARRLQPPNAEAAFEYYGFLSLNEREQEAHALLDQILVWEPLFAPGRLERAKLLAPDQPQAAIRDAELVLGSTEDLQMLRSAHYFLARTYHSLGKAERARRHQAWVEAHPSPRAPR